MDMHNIYSDDVDTPYQWIDSGTHKHTCTCEIYGPLRLLFYVKTYF